MEDGPFSEQKAQQCVHPISGKKCRSHGGGSRRVFRQFAWLEVGSVKVALSRPAPPDRACRDHQPSSGCYATGNASRSAAYGIMLTYPKLKEQSYASRSNCSICLGTVSQTQWLVWTGYWKSH